MYVVHVLFYSFTVNYFFLHPKTFTMKGVLRFLVLGALFFGVSHVMASGYLHKVEISKTFHDLQPACIDHQEVVIERVDFEVLPITNVNEVVTGVKAIVLPVAHGPPKANTKTV